MPPNREVGIMKLTMRLGADSYDIVIKRGALGNLGQLTDLANR